MIQKWKLKEVGKRERFRASFDEKWKVSDKHDRMKNSVS